MGAKTKVNEENTIWKPDSSNIYERFIEQLDEAVSGERELTDGDQDTRYALKLQQERLQEKNAKLRYHITPRGSFAKGKLHPRKWMDTLYESQIMWYSCEWEREITAGEGKPFRQKRKTVIYETKTDVIGGQSVKDEVYVCPGCGAPSKIKDLMNGCPYCGVKFQMSELYPKISNHYMVEDAGRTDRELKSYIGKFMIGTGIGFLILLIISSFVRGEVPPIKVSTVIFWLLGAGIGGVVGGYILSAYVMIGYAFVQAGRTVPMLGTLGSGKRFENHMKRYSPEFSYEYFTGKVISMLKMVLFAKDPQELPFYLGKSLDTRFHDLVDILFRGAVGFQGMKEKDGYLHVTVDVFLDNAYIRDGKVSANNREKLRVTLVKNLNVPIQYNFSVKKMECPNCHGSFDATKNKTCPFCNGTYRIEDADWAIESIEMK